MPTPATERFQALTAGLGVEVFVSEFLGGTRTATDAAAAVGCAVDAIVKSLVFIADDRPALLLVSGGNRVAETRLATMLGATAVRKATADEVGAATGYAIGGAPPFGRHGDGVDDVRLDPTLLEHDMVWAAAGAPSTVFPIPSARRVDAAGARVVAIMEVHHP